MTPQAHRVHVPPKNPPARMRRRDVVIGVAAILAWTYFFVFQLPALVK